MRRTLTHLHHAFWITILSLAILVAVVMSGARLLTPWLNSHQPAIEHWASSLVGRPLAISSLQIGWYRLSPILKCDTVILFNAEKKQPVLQIGELDISFNLIQSLLTGHLQLGLLKISGIHLWIQQLADGQLTVNGGDPFSLTPTTTQTTFNTQEVLTWLLSQPKIYLDNLIIHVYDSRQKLLPLINLNLWLKNTASSHTLAGQANFSQAQPKTLKPNQLIPLRPLNGKTTNNAWCYSGLSNTHCDLLNANDGTINFILKLNGKWTEPQKLSAEFYVDTRNLHLIIWPLFFPQSQWQIKSGTLNTQLWGSWQNQQLQSIQSQLTLQNLQLNKQQIKTTTPLTANLQGNIAWQRQTQTKWLLQASFKQINFSRWQKFPGFTNLRAFLTLTPQDNNVKVQGENVSADFGKLFRQPLTLQKLYADISWHADAQGWSVHANSLQAQTSDVIAKGRLGLQIPQDFNNPLLSLLVNYQVNSAQRLPNYLPLGIMSPKLVNWLEHSIKKVSFAQGTLILHGLLHDFPYANKEGVFVIDSYITAAELAYWPNWPAIQQLSGELIFNNHTMHFSGDTAQVLGTSINSLEADIPVLKKGVDAVLTINSQINTQLSNAQQFIKQSPLKNTFNLVQDTQLNGPMQLALQLVIPLEHHEAPIKVTGQLATKNATLVSTTNHLEVKQIQGTVHFDHDGITPSALKAILWDQPVQILLEKRNNLAIQVKGPDYFALIAPQENGWQLQLQSNFGKGNIFLPKDHQKPVQANFQTLTFNTQTKQQSSDWQPTQLPPLNFTCKDVRYDNKQFGQIQFQLSPLADGTQINNLRATAATYQLTANGSWRLVDKRGATQLNGKITSTDVANTLLAWDMPAGITAKSATLNFRLVWPGAPYDFQIKQARGTLTLELSNGQITKVSSNTAAKMDIGRLLNLLSFESLQRRLRLDFADLTDKGLTFDKVAGTFTLRAGSATTTNAYLDGPIATVNINGRIGLAAEDYNLQLKVTPHLTSSLPIIVGIAGGPIAGAVTWVANKLLGPEVRKITTDTYRITGSWSNPNIQRIN